MNDRDLLNDYGHVLSDKQRRVFELHARGLTERAIALALDLARGTVRDHLTAARRNLARARHHDKETAA